jgi:hypothetical protein
MIKYVVSGEVERMEDVPEGAQIISINDVDVIDTCEACGKPILESQEFWSDRDGISVHKDTEECK